jgi:hypothetical protein
MAFIGQISGRHYNSYEEMVANEKIAAAHRDREMIQQQDDILKTIPLETLRVVADRAAYEDKTQQDRLATKKNADAFIAVHPELIDNKSNAFILLNQARTMFGDGELTVNNLEDAYQYLRDRTDFLKLDAKELAKQQKAQAKAHYETERARSVRPTEQELYDMPLEDLRRLDTIDNQKRMQRIGEEGGW